MSEPTPDMVLHEALHAAAHEAGAAALASGYEVPEAAVRTVARRRRIVRATGASVLSLGLLAGAGVALAQLSPEDASPVASSGRGHPSCGTEQLAEVFPLTMARLTAEPRRDLRATVGEDVDLRVTLENAGRSGEQLVADEGGPVLLAVDAHSVVVGWAELAEPPGPTTLAAGEQKTFAGFGPVQRCPGAADASTHPYLAPGSYGAYVGHKTSPGEHALDVWESVGDLTVDRAGSAPSAGAPLPTGTCGARTGTRWATTALHLTTSPTDLVVAPGSSPEVEIQLVNQTRSRVVSPAAGGPVLFVTGPDKRIVAILEPFDDVPSDGLGPGGRFTFSDLPALTDCATGEPLPEGTYEYQLARRQPQGERLFDLWTPPRVLLVTSQEVERHLVAWPAMPVCGEVVDQLALDPGAVPSRFTHFDVIELEGSGETGGGGAGPDHAVIETFVELDEPITSDTGIRVVRWHHVLLREGRVVAAMEWDVGEDDELDGEPGRLDSTPVTLVFTDCQTGDLHVLDGEYVTFGYLGYEIEHPPGIRELWTVALGPHPFEHHP